MTEQIATYTTDIARVVAALLAEDKDLVIYRKSLKKITGSVVSAILLSQMMYWHKKSKGEPFYKFRSPCAHEDYREGDSWTEEIGISSSSFDRALKKIGTKITQGASKIAAYEKDDTTGIVIYWTDASRKTWYTLNMNLLGNLLSDIYLVDTEQVFTSLITETTTETISEEKPSETSLQSEKQKAKKEADSLLADLRDRKSAVKKTLTTEKPAYIAGIEASIFADRQTTDADMAKDRGETLEDRLIGWRNVGSVKETHVILLAQFCESFGAMPPRAKNQRNQSSTFYAWLAGLDALIENAEEKDAVKLVRELGMEIDGDTKKEFYRTPNSLRNKMLDKATAPALSDTDDTGTVVFNSY